MDIAVLTHDDQKQLLTQVHTEYWLSLWPNYRVVALVSGVGEAGTSHMARDH